MVVFDASILLLALDSAARAPQGVKCAAERVKRLILDIAGQGGKIGIPTPALSEVLVRAGAMHDEYLQVLNDDSIFAILPFDYKAALNAADDIRGRGLRAESGGRGTTRAKIKFDRQIVAIAKVNGADAIYSDDADIIRHAQRAGLAARRSADLDMPPEQGQGGTPEAP